MTINERIKTLLDIISEGIYEKEQIIAMSLLSAMAGESIFLLGPPGTAKSLVARRLKLAFKDARSFEYLMSRFSTPDDIFGPVSISLLKNEDKYERAVDGFLPTATVVFLDEIWKAGPSIQNSLLTAINEKIYQNGAHTLHLPMKALIAASNELPAENEGLEALWDRFLVRMVSDNIRDEDMFYQMIRQQTVVAPRLTDGLLITDEQYKQWQEKANAVTVPDDICKTISVIRKGLRSAAEEEDAEAMDFYVSDRRWKKCVHLMQTSALLNDRCEIDVTDLLLLFHCLWNKAEHIAKVIEIVSRALPNKYEQQLSQIESNIDSILSRNNMSSTVRNAISRQKKNTLGYHEIANFPYGRCLIDTRDYDSLPEDNPTAALLYRDPLIDSWIIEQHKNNVTHSSHSKKEGQQIVEIQPISDGLIISSIPYAFLNAEKNHQHGDKYGADTSKGAPLENELRLLTEELRPGIEKMYNTVYKCENIFVSRRDANTASDYVKKVWDKIEQTHMKLANTQQLLG